MSAEPEPGSGGDSRVTVVVASRNRRDLLLETLPRHLELPERPSVVLVDDASTDGTADAVAETLPDVDVVRLERNLGAVARNIGTQRAATPYVAFCDDDSWFSPGSLSRAADVLDATPQLAVLNARILVGPQEKLDPVCAEMAESPLPAVAGQPGHPLLSFVACGVVVRRDAFLSVGGFSPLLRFSGEEELLGWDLAAAGWTLSYVPDVVAHHHPPPHDGRPQRRERGIRNQLWTTWLRRPVGAALRRTLRDLRSFPVDRVTARAVAKALVGAPAVLRERRVSPPEVERLRRLLDDQQLASEARRYV